MPAEEGGSRANPTGGENGDGHEMGQDYENTISTAVAFFFQNNGAGVNGDANTPVRYEYFDAFQEYTEGNGNGIDRVYKTKPIPTDLYGEYNVLVVANPGSGNWWTTTTPTLGAVRDEVLTQAWTKTGDDYTNFLMSSAADATIQITEANNTVSTAANTTVDVERMAARVDYKKLGSYTCTDPNYADATVKIEGAVLVNNLTLPGSYAMKRVSTATTDGTINYLGDETLGANGLPNNWVLDPTTGKKETGASFGVSWKDPDAINPKWWADKATDGKTITKKDGDWNILGYTLENITARDETKHDYNTAVVFKAKFHPVGLQNYQDGATFFELNKKIYASMEDMIANFYDNKKISDIDAEVTACTSWEDVEDLASDLKGIDPSGYKQWLQGQIDESKTLNDVMKNSLTWTSYMLNECGYSATLENGVYTVKINQGDKITADILAKYGARTYEDATCYYTWWIRHANDGNEDTNGTMEYAIVRNNIYELNVTKISSLGGYIPNEEEKGFIVNVYVKDWTLLKGETIQM